MKQRYVAYNQKNCPIETQDLFTDLGVIIRGNPYFVDQTKKCLTKLESSLYIHFYHMTSRLGVK